MEAIKWEKVEVEKKVRFQAAYVRSWEGGEHRHCRNGQETTVAAEERGTGA